METRPAGGGVVTFGLVRPTLNSERNFEETLRSVWRQRSGQIDVDHVVVEGGSIDGTIEIASRFSSRTGAASESGTYKAINRGLDLIRGDIVGYINTDDEIAQNARPAVVCAFSRRSDDQWLCGRVEHADASGGVIARMEPVRASVRSYVAFGWACIPKPTVWFRRSIFARVRPFDAAYRNFADYDLYARALGMQHPLILDEDLAWLGLHDDQLSLDAKLVERERRMVQVRHGARGVGSFLSGRLLSLRLKRAEPGVAISEEDGEDSVHRIAVRVCSSESLAAAWELGRIPSSQSMHSSTMAC
jgi:glycosyltransferase involved in cell wall biosynthesis